MVNKMREGEIVPIEWVPMPALESKDKVPVLFRADGTALTKGPIGFNTKGPKS